MFRKFIIIAISIFLGLFLAFLTAEIALRVIDYDYIPLRIRKLGRKIKDMPRSDWRGFHSVMDDRFIYDPELIWRPRKKYGPFNSQGFKGPEVDILKKANEYRIFTIGDSNTLGPEQGCSWPEYLGQLFKRKKPNVFVINAGVYGYTSFQGLRCFEKILKYKPDMVLISFGSNDCLRVTIPDKEYVSSKKFFKSGLEQFRVCYLFIAFSDIILMKKREKNQLVPRVSLKEYSDNLNKMIKLADKNHIKVVLLTRPFIGKSPHRLWWKNFAPEYNELSKKIAKDNNVLAIDIYSHFKDKAEYFVDGSHFNDIGYRIAAELIYDYIKDINVDTLRRTAQNSFAKK